MRIVVRTLSCISLFSVLAWLNCASNTPQIVDVYSYKFMTADSYVPDRLEFKDDRLLCRLTPQESVIEVDLYNIGPDPISVLWDQAALIDSKGVSHPVVHKDVILSDTIRRQTPTLILPQGMLSDSVSPVDHIYSDVSGWKQRPLFPRTSQASNLKGMTFTVILPIKFQDEVKQYTLPFQVTDIQVTRIVKR